MRSRASKSHGRGGAARWVARRRSLLACLAAIVAGCARGAAPPSTTPPVLEEGDSGRTLQLGVGDLLDVRLAATPGTGYGWEIAALDREVVAERDRPGSRPVEPVRPGSAARETFRFEARRPGTARLLLVYRRPWEHGVPPARTFSLDVTVR